MAGITVQALGGGDAPRGVHYAHTTGQEASVDIGGGYISAGSKGIEQTVRRTAAIDEVWK